MTVGRATVVVGSNIHTLRLSRHHTRRDTAKLMGVSQRTIQYWEEHVRLPSAYHLFLLAGVYDVTMEAFFEEDHRW